MMRFSMVSVRRQAAWRRSVSSAAFGDKFFASDGFLVRGASSDVNEFEVMGVSPHVKVDLRKVEDNMRALQRRLHPDKFAQTSEDERLKAEEASSRVNACYAVVKDPLLRANAAITLETGRNVLAEESDQSKIDMDLLMEVMDTREAIEAAENPETLENLKNINNDNMRKTHTRLIDAYEQHDFQQAADELLRLQYYSKIRTEIFAQSEKNQWPLHQCKVPII